jgi:hypothetical protein
MYSVLLHFCEVCNRVSLIVPLCTAFYIQISDSKVTHNCGPAVTRHGLYLFSSLCCSKHPTATIPDRLNALPRYLGSVHNVFALNESPALCVRIWECVLSHSASQAVRY